MSHIDEEWHIFIIPIVSCANVIVAPGNPSIITSVGMEVYNFIEIVYVHHEIWMFKNHGFLIHFCGGQPCPPQYKVCGKTMILKCNTS